MISDSETQGHLGARRQDRSRACGLQQSSGAAVSDDDVCTHVAASLGQRGARTAKSGFNYLAARVATIEGRTRGYSEMVLLKEAGRVAEFIGSGLLMEPDGVVCSPPPSESAFESIRVENMRSLCANLGIPFVTRPIERTELIVADELASVGTLNDLVIISAIDERLMGHAPVLEALLGRYLAAADGIRPHSAIDKTFRD